MNYTSIPEDKIAVPIVLSLVCFIFCVLATIVLVYFVHRRYSLCLEIKELTSEKLWFASYHNHMKNLKIQVMISNFIILIILIEILNNIANIFINVGLVLPYYPEIISTAIYVRCYSQYCYVPLLCLLLKVIWLAYFHVPYKYTIMRWIAYIVLRSILIYLVYGRVLSELGTSYDLPISIFYLNMMTAFITVDLITYLVYSRRLYLHLKSRELEAKLFMDRTQYLQNKNIRIHFMVATILVALALFFYNLMSILSSISVVVTCILYLFSFKTFLDEWYLLDQWINTYAMESCQIMYRILLNLNYLYVFLAIVYKYCRQKRNLKRVNDSIRPIVRGYQDKLYSRYNRYY